MWQVVQQQSVKHYGMLEEFVSLVTEAVPQLLTDRQRGLLLLALRVKVTLSDPADDQAHLERIHSVSEASNCHVGAAVIRAAEVSHGGFQTFIRTLFGFNADQSRVTGLSGMKESPGDCDSQSEGSELTASTLHSVSDSCQRVAHRCPECGKCFIYRSQVSVYLHVLRFNQEVSNHEPSPQVIRHLRSNRTCGSAGKPGSGALQVQSEGPEVDPCPPQPRPVRTHTCFQCSTIFKTRTELLFHQRTHRIRLVYKCNQCDWAFQHLSSLTNHKQTHLDKDGFACSKCSRTFESSNERDVHRLQHRLPDLSCSVCAQTFTSQTLLLRHLQTHSAQGAQCVYSCLFCDQSFSGKTPSDRLLLLRTGKQSET
ncbi:hypothetical protein XENOCAPTIV_019656 [Xenoophorus captivus]|uniref:C2H2-type domain-containing protein n=1 Tax=Xenoophorus captivus TaxID=1517983 RepID=A0ABV0RD77_9TELE